MGVHFLTMRPRFCGPPCTTDRSATSASTSRYRDTRPRLLPNRPIDRMGGRESAWSQIRGSAFLMTRLRFYGTMYDGKVRCVDANIPLSRYAPQSSLRIDESVATGKMGRLCSIGRYMGEVFQVRNYIKPPLDGRCATDSAPTSISNHFR